MVRPVRPALLLTLLGLAALALAACGGGAAAATAIPTGATTAPAPTTAQVSGGAINVSGSDVLRFEPSTFKVKAGQPVTIVFTDKGVLNHTFTVADLAVNLEVAKQNDVARQTFTFTKTGSFALTCTVVGHKEAGMVGTFTVEP
ncbi:MAG: hypothetical protein EXR60_05660 [Dehalococcoidia bacterium]|nr:hypothetical protein [Dehalococcoidia bacterium]